MVTKKTLIIENLKYNQMLEGILKGKRLDGRGLLDSRELTIETGFIEKANGSARVKLGKTDVVAGIKIQTGVPFPDSADKGLIIVTAEILPIAASWAEPGPPGEEVIELARVVDRGVRESQIINLKDLCLVEGKNVLAIFIDISVLNVDGNLFDASSYAAIAALLTTTMPKYKVTKDKVVEDTGKQISLPTKLIPVSVTMALLNNTLIVDPTLDEESIMDARFTLTSADKNVLCAGQKGISGGFSPEQIELAADIALKHGEKIRKILKKCAEHGKKN